MTVGIIGAGAFGTALAQSLSRNSPVRLWARSIDHCQQMIRSGQNQHYLPDIALNPGIEITNQLEDLSENGVLLLAVPMQHLRSILTQHSALFQRKTLVACCKGIELGSGMGPVSVIGSAVPLAVPAVLTGPSFAADIARGLPTALTIACSDPAVGTALQHELATENLRTYRTTDTIGAELGGALKNVMAIACGTVMGAGLGESARAALMTRGFAEMTRMALSLGARPETLSGLSGFGDLALTCSSDLSRNFRLGAAIGEGKTFDSSITVEGAATARAVARQARELDLDLPITDTVVALLDRSVTPKQAMADLLARPLKEE